VTHDLESYGLVLLFALVAIEGCGIPVPGETALIAPAVLAAAGHFAIVEVIAVAAAGAIVGDNTGYWIARQGGRPLLERIPLAGEAVSRFLPKSERFFARHGPKALVVARFVAGLRIAAAWLAGLSHMPWRRFAAYNAVGGILWATAIGLAAFWFGQAAVEAVATYGVYAVIAIAGVGAIGFTGYRILRRRRKGREPVRSNSNLESDRTR
jgi:membrane protein DedA with SNARE-associated domain